MRFFAASGLGSTTGVFPAQTVNVPQLDLLAMRWGVTLTAEPVEDMPEYTWITIATATVEDDQA